MTTNRKLIPAESRHPSVVDERDISLVGVPTSRISVTASFYFETSRAAGTPEEILTRMCHEQTTTGYDTLSRRSAAQRLKNYQASIRSLRLLPSRNEVDIGFAEIDFPWNSISQAGNSLEDTLCFVMGESSHVHGIVKLRLIDLHLPADMIKTLPGPRYGVPGLRDNLGVGQRPLLMGPMRPEVGMSPKEYAAIAYEALVAGSDIVKDDELLVDPPYCPIEERAKLCARSAREAEQKTGERKMFVLHLGCDFSRIEQLIRIGEAAKVDGFMVQPRLTPSLLTFMRSRSNLPLIAHYSLLTTVSRYADIGIELPLMLKLFRMSGADVVTFPRPNSRFDVDPEEFEANLKIVGEPLGGMRSSFPFPTGGNRAEDASQCYSILGNLDYGFVAGSAMFEEPGGIRIGAARLRECLDALTRQVA